MDKIIYHGDHAFYPVASPSGTQHGLHCCRCGHDVWEKCPTCGEWMYGAMSDGSSYCVPCRKCSWYGGPRPLGRLSYCSDGCAKAGGLDRRRVRHNK